MWWEQEYFKTKRAAEAYIERHKGKSWTGESRIISLERDNGLYREGFRWLVQVKSSADNHADGSMNAGIHPAGAPDYIGVRFPIPGHDGNDLVCLDLRPLGVGDNQNSVSRQADLENQPRPDGLKDGHNAGSQDGWHCCTSMTL